ncbi:unnamed protein product [Mytilus coruscus]|uniref:IRS-type PTB domain-containing protein n=1 Tax=Mytilus coruscus TaxID=42192 RepID=A0A6J8DPN0_MYTCO|nr:unnamed protein product [Mytilus coruscus]
MSDSKYLIKEGEITIRSGILKQKHKRFCKLCNDGDLVVLECYESKEHTDKVKNTFTLVHVKGLDKVVKESSKEFYIDVHLKKEKFSLIFSNQNETESWHNCLQNNAHFTEGREDSSNVEDDDTGLKDNILYDSGPGDTDRFDVMLKPNEDTKKLGLTSTYRLHVSNVCLMLEDLVKQEAKYRWYYNALRKYGRQGNDFVIEAGRKSETGAGTFIFIYEDPSKITKAIDKLTKRKANEQLTSKLNFSSSETERPVSNRMSEPIQKRENSPTPPKKASSVKESTDTKTPLSRQHSAHLSPNFKHELEDVVSGKSKTISDKSSKSKKEKQETKDEKKEEKKKGFGAFFKSSKDKKPKDKMEQEVDHEGDEEYPENLYDEPELPSDLKRHTEPLYEEADQKAKAKNKRASSSDKKPLKPQEHSVYAQAHPLRHEAWKNHGAQEEEHLENYESIKAAASLKGQRKSFDKITNDDEEIDDTYDHAFLAERNLKRENIANDSKNIYGTSSGREPEADYELGDPEDEPVEYDDAFSTQQKFLAQPAEAYEEVDIRSST